MTKTAYFIPSFFKFLNFLEILNPFKKPALKAENVILEDDPVYLIASGYEWTCPHCHHLTHEIEITKQVRCRGCGRGYPVAEADHAWE